MANPYEFLKSKYPDEARYRTGIPTFTALEVLTLLKEYEASISFQPPVSESLPSDIKDKKAELENSLSKLTTEYLTTHYTQEDYDYYSGIIKNKIAELEKGNVR